MATAVFNGESVASVHASVTTTFSRRLIEANAWLAEALEVDGNSMFELLNTAHNVARECQDAAYEHSLAEKLVAANLISTIDAVRMAVK